MAGRTPSDRACAPFLHGPEAPPQSSDLFMELWRCLNVKVRRETVTWATTELPRLVTPHIRMMGTCGLCCLEGASFLRVRAERSRTCQYRHTETQTRLLPDRAEARQAVPMSERWRRVLVVGEKSGAREPRLPQPCALRQRQFLGACALIKYLWTWTRSPVRCGHCSCSVRLGWGRGEGGLRMEETSVALVTRQTSHLSCQSRHSHRSKSGNFTMAQPMIFTCTGTNYGKILQYLLPVKFYGLRHGGVTAVHHHLLINFLPFPINAPAVLLSKLQI